MIKSKYFKKGTAALLTLAMAVSLCAIFAGTGEAKVSLPAVEQIKASATEADPFTILEIVPEKKQGSIGYYINGEEPWVLLTGSKYSGSTGSPAERTNFVNTKLQSLLNQKYAGTEPGQNASDADKQAYAENYFELALSNGSAVSADSYPLSFVGGYDEVYPWNATDAQLSTWKQMPLANSEKNTLQGSMEYVGYGNGDYIIGGYTYLPEGGGDCMQLVTSLRANPEAGDEGYWYNVSFAPLNYSSGSDLNKGNLKDTLIFEDAKVSLIQNGKYYTEVTVDKVVGDAGAYTYYVKDPSGEPIEQGSSERYSEVTVDLESGGKYYAEVNSEKLVVFGESSDISQNKYLRYIGVVGDPDFPGLVADSSYSYYKVAYGRPYQTKDEAKRGSDYTTDSFVLFAPLVGGFKEADGGYFSKINYEYVGSGNGAYEFNPGSAGDESYTLTTKLVYYTGGFKNNNWFLKYVMDYTDEELQSSETVVPVLHVNTVAASAVTASQINAADMIVINYGLNISGDSFKAVYKNDFANTGAGDLSSEVLGLLKNATASDVDGAKSKPVIFDYNLTGTAATNANAYANQLLTRATTLRKDSGFTTADAHSFVANHIYCIDSLGYSTGGGDNTVYHQALPLATAFFNAPMLEGDNLLKSGPFYPVYEEIYYENFLREIRNNGEDAKLSTDLSSATAVRYIINFANTRQTKYKTTVNVLDLEPRTGSMADDGKATKLKSWLAASAGVGLDELTLNITTMSVSEFIGTQANICEEYDLIYVGDSVKGFKTAKASIIEGWLGLGIVGDQLDFKYISYNDYAMSYRVDSNQSSINKGTVTSYIKNRLALNWIATPSDVTFGMRYTAIGDKSIARDSNIFTGSTYTGYNLSGLLDRDYTQHYVSDSFASVGIDTQYLYFGNVLKKTEDARTFRYSGNDLSKAASEKLKAFAGLGYPVIYADTLLKAPEISGSATDATANKRFWLWDYSYSTSSKILCEDLTLKVSLSDASVFIANARVSLYESGHDAEPIATKTISRTGSAVFNLADYEGFTFKNGNKLTISSVGEYYCKIDISSVRSKIVWLWQSAPDSASSGRTQTVKIFNEADPMFVDNSSYMFDTINSTIGKTNVMRWGSLDSSVTDVRQTLLARFVNLSKPTIVFTNTADYYPTSYAMDDAGVMNHLEDKDDDGFYSLEYVFKIQNEADPYPDTTRYEVNLYLDMDSNGLFTEDEAVNDVSLKSRKTSGMVGVRVSNGELLGSYGEESKNQHYYYLSYQLPTSVVGIVPWKLEISDKSSFGGHDSVIDYTRIEPATQPKVLQILQIDSSDQTKHFSLQNNIANGGKYKTYLDAVSSDFKVNIATIKADFNTNWVDNTTSYEITDENKVTTKYEIKLTKDGDKYYKTISTNDVAAEPIEYATISDFLKSFDMLVIGFGDSYHNLDFDATAGLADYINSNMPVLMTHDSNLFFTTHGIATNSSRGNYNFIGSGRGEWDVYFDRIYSAEEATSYYSSMLIRDLIKQDRYGVTSLKLIDSVFPNQKQTIGMTGFADMQAVTDSSGGDAVATQKKESTLRQYIMKTTGITDWNGGFVSSSVYYNSGTSLTDPIKKQLGELTENNYSIAWKAGTANDRTVSETQGLTSSTLLRFEDDRTTTSYNPSYSTTGDFSRLGLTNKVTQVNKGQITTYPYNINQSVIGGSNSSPLNVAETHGQSYQLNINSDDMIVWYCLADDTQNDGVYQKNDVINDYYIYTCGNVTYTGAGHSANNTDSSFTDDEVKLFVNTMIASYRADRDESSISFSNDDGTVKGITDFFLVTDGDTILRPDGAYKDSARNIYFTINDSNVGSSKFISASFYFGDITEHAEPLKLTIYNAETNTALASSESLKSTYTYYVKLSDVLAALPNGTSDANILGSALRVKLTTTIAGVETPVTATANLTLRQYKLFDLS